MLLPLQGEYTNCFVHRALPYAMCFWAFSPSHVIADNHKIFLMSKHTQQSTSKRINMKKIELTQQEIALIEQSLQDSGYYDRDNDMMMIVNRIYPDEERACMMALIDKAQALQHEIDPEMESLSSEWNCDLLLWYYKQYLAQENKKY
jgi:hypothetical protein